MSDHTPPPCPVPGCGLPAAESTVTDPTDGIVRITGVCKRGHLFSAQAFVGGAA